MKQSWKIWLCLVPLALLVLGFLFFPTMNMVMSSFQSEDGSFTLANYQELFSEAYYLQSITNSLKIAFLSATVAIIIAVIGGYSISQLAGRGNKWMTTISNMTSYFEGIPLAFSFIVLLGNNGLFTLLFNQLGLDVFGDFNLYSWFGLVVVYIYFQIPFAIILLLPTYQALNDDWRYASQLLGGTTWTFWRKIGIPLLFPGVIGTYTILIANALGAFATANALVGSTYNLMPIQIASLISGDVFLQPNLASAFGVLLALIMIAALWSNSKIMKKVRRDLR
ncbi:ABC transporter permease [Gracilibacillus timonensis]|uniref:ABC transporter permease n=1 Tax=Gracilibacillus timonensis TaxID=1816696 RepID=UPI000826F7F1|nr:ABC transporter permease subunit [Gracilibacillus timonensis]